MADVKVSSGLTSAYAGGAPFEMPATSAVEHDDVVYPDSTAQPTPDPEAECCCKTINITLHFH